jgi:hypothetical protein
VLTRDEVQRALAHIDGAREMAFKGMAFREAQSVPQ